MMQKRETTDGRFVEVAPSQWWDTQGINIVPEWVVDAYLNSKGNVGIVVQSDDAIPNGTWSPTLRTRW
jgi:hypothetical protein